MTESDPGPIRGAMIDRSVLRAIEKFRLPVVSIDVARGGHSSAVRTLTLGTGSAVILKVPWSRGKLRRECSTLVKLRDHPLVPKILHILDESDCYAIVMTQLPGRPIEGLDLLRNDRLGGQVGECLARIHATSDDAVPLDWWRQLCARVAGFASLWRRDPRYLGADIEDAKQTFETAAFLMPVMENICLAHFDFRLTNLLHIGNDLTGVVDFESSRVGVPDYDFTQIAVECTSEPMTDGTLIPAAILRGYARIRDVPPTLFQTLPMHLFYNAAACVTWCLKRNVALSDPFLLKNQSVLKRAMSDLRLSN